MTFRLKSGAISRFSIRHPSHEERAEPAVTAQRLDGVRFEFRVASSARLTSDRSAEEAHVNIGITGGSTLIVLGSREEVCGFFNRVWAISESLDQDARFICDRLYRRYLRPSELASASRFLAVIGSRVAPEAREFHTRFEASFDKCAESASLNFEAFRETEGYSYEAVRLVLADSPWFSVEKKRSIQDYDQLTGDPFWKKEPNQPLQRNASTGSVLNFESPVRRG
jgi:hypothetical protein